MNSTPTGSELSVRKVTIRRTSSTEGHHNYLNLYFENGMLSLHLTPQQFAAIVSSVPFNVWSKEQ